MSKKEGRYYVEYLGWKEAHGLYGREFTEPIVRELLARRRQSGILPRMTIKVSEQEIQISQEHSKQSSSRPEKVRYPAIPTKDVTFVVKGHYPDTDVAACIFLGYNPYTKCGVHIHVYRFDSENTASMFVDHLSRIISLPEYQQRILGIEKDLSELGHVTMRRSAGTSNGLERANGHASGSDGYSYGTPSPHSSDGLSPKYPTMEEALKARADIRIVKTPKQEPDKKVKRIFASLQEEFEYKVNMNDTPLLLPPKDYDTVVRRHGHLEIRDQSKSTERSIIGPNGIFSHSEAEPYLVTLDEASSGNNKTASDSLDISGSSNNNNTTHDKSYGNSYLKPVDHTGLRRSQSDSQANLQRPSSMHRQLSQASSDKGSANSDEFYADGLYQGYKPFKKSKSKDKGHNSFIDDQLDMAMWSPSFSFGQSGARMLHPHTEEENDTLSRTAPSGFLPRQQMPRSATHKKQNVKRSNSHRQNGQITDRQYRR